MKYVAGIIIMAVFTLIPLFGLSNVTHAFDPLDKTCLKANENAGGQVDAQAICDKSETLGNPITGSDGVITTVANLLSLAAGIIAVIIVVLAGITMMTSNGDAGKITSSRNAIIYTVVGLIVIVISRTIVVFVMSRVASQ